jgi:hypothetical protein
MGGLDCLHRFRCQYLHRFRCQYSAFISIRDYQEVRARGRFSSLAGEPVAADDGELGLGLEPFARRPFPFVSRVVQNQV